MIKKDSAGNVVEYEDEAALGLDAKMATGKDSRGSKNRKDQPATLEALEQARLDTLRAIDEQVDTEIKASVKTASAKVVEIEATSEKSRNETRRALSQAIAETNRLCRDAIASLEAETQVSLYKLRSLRWSLLNSVNAQHEIDLKAAEDKRLSLKEGANQQYLELKAKLEAKLAPKEAPASDSCAPLIG